MTASPRTLIAALLDDYLEEEEMHRMCPKKSSDFSRIYSLWDSLERVLICHKNPLDVKIITFERVGSAITTTYEHSH
ncbi:hypothetical protein TNCT_237661 [Trichonephila clavata]|uniref:Uncharacterized protein n=1 Tax=Trichonephila clavata TaxID=2740835 RepID=A0A8X6GRM8_TRICU|nr:hypothetical protein TNCT_237661 [Trichonephila clavata]